MYNKHGPPAAGRDSFLYTALGAVIPWVIFCGCRPSGSVPVGADAGEAEVTATHVTGPTFVNPASVEPVTTETTFSIRNVGQSAVSLKLAGQSCGCTTVDMGDTTIESGETTTVRVTSRLPTGTGRELHHVVLEVDRGYPRAIRLNLENYRYSRLAVAPAVPLYPRVAPDAPFETTMRVVAYQPESEPVIELTSETRGEGLSSELSRPEARSIGGGVREVSAILTLRIDASADQDSNTSIGPRVGRVMVHAGEGCHVQRSISWVPATPLEAVPDRLFVQSSGAESRGTIVLRAREPFQVLGIEVSEGWIAASTDQDQVAGRHIIQVTVRPEGLQERAREGWLRIHTNHPGQTLARVPVLLLRSSGG